jgi:hypothetical protein
MVDRTLRTYQLQAVEIELPFCRYFRLRISEGYTQTTCSEHHESETGRQAHFASTYRLETGGEESHVDEQDGNSTDTSSLAISALNLPDKTGFGGLSSFRG